MFRLICIGVRETKKINFSRDDFSAIERYR